MITLLSLAWREWPDESQPLFNTVRPLSLDESVREPLEITQPGLHRLDVALVCSRPVSGQVILRLTSDKSGMDEIVSATVPAQMAENISRQIRRPYRFVSFNFPALVNVAGQEVWLWLELDSEADEELGIRCLESEGWDDRITLQMYYQKSHSENLSLFVKRLADKPGGVLGRVFGFPGLLILYAGLLALLCVKLLNRGGQDGHDNIKYGI